MISLEEVRSVGEEFDVATGANGAAIRLTSADGGITDDDSYTPRGVLPNNTGGQCNSLATNVH